MSFGFGSLSFGSRGGSSASPGEPPALPGILLKAILTFGDPTKEGRLVEAVAIPWFEIMRIIKSDPRAIYEIDDRKWEEIIAGAYERAGFDEVILTPRSGDYGRDVIATRSGVGSIRVYDQVKAYAETNPVPANDVRALIGVLTGFQNVSKGVITTTSSFAPGVATDPGIAPLVPHRIELRPREVLLPWLDDLASRGRG
jgi:restriction system protein